MKCLCDGYVIDLSKMRSCRVDAETQTIRVDGGAILSDVYKESAAYGLFLPAGVISHTGIGGLSLFGGVGWLCREFGLTCDHILEVDLITADGELRVVNKDQHPDLFWGIRGAGPCLGIVTSFKFRLIKSTTLVAGPMMYPWPKFNELFEIYRKHTFSEENFTRKEYSGLSAAQVPNPKSATHVEGMKIAMLINCLHGTEEEWKATHQPFVELGPIFGGVQQHSTVDWFCGNDRYSAAGYWYQKGLNVDVLAPEIGTIIAEAFEHPPTIFSQVVILPFGGKISEVAEEDTAFCSRKARFGINIECRWENPNEGDKCKVWARELFAKLAPFKSSSTYINFEANEEKSDGKEYFGTNFERLQALKTKYDPKGIFRSIVQPL
eukprot:Phypoly_transcript_06314.p1 GENE.Phypoly_transcript_06314~~Phypoly_transcript_06314.p1  ORF type:complete len:379 (+),score=46.83 Phypoly_transcript_06314:531-1667(+)